MVGRRRALPWPLTARTYKSNNEFRVTTFKERKREQGWQTTHSWELHDDMKAPFRWC